MEVGFRLKEDWYIDIDVLGKQVKKKIFDKGHFFPHVSTDRFLVEWEGVQRYFRAKEMFEMLNDAGDDHKFEYIDEFGSFIGAQEYLDKNKTTKYAVDPINKKTTFYDKTIAINMSLSMYTDYFNFCEENSITMAKRLRKYIENDIQNWKKGKILKMKEKERMKEKEKELNQIRRNRNKDNQNDLLL